MTYPDRSYYDTLGIPRSASDAQIKAAYREQIKFFHPDVFQGSPEIARQKSQELNEAYGVLIDPEKRKAYDTWLRMKDYQKAQEKRKAEEETRKEEERRKEAEEQERKQKEAAEEKERQKAEEAEDWKRRKEQWEQAECERSAEQREKAREDAKSEQSRSDARKANSLLAAFLAISIVVGYYAYSNTNSALMETKADLEKTQYTLVQLSEDSVRMHSLCNYYKRSEECCAYVLDTFRDMYSVTPIFTTFGDAETFRNNVRERIEGDLSLVEDCYDKCANLEITTEDDLALLRDVQGLCEKSFEYLNRLENGVKQEEAGVAADASGNTMQAISVMYTARSLYWELADTE